MGEQLESITIVGGGTAGWMAAAMLDTFLNRMGGGDRVHIRLIESPDTPTIGVGEATVPAMPRLLQQLGIDQEAFFRRCNASFKLAVKFDRWNVDDAGDPYAFLNPFNHPPLIKGVDAGLYYQRFGQNGPAFEKYTGMGADLIEKCKGPGQLGGAFKNNRVTTAYHLDAGQFAKLLQETATARGVEHVLDHLEDVELDENGYVAALQLRSGGRTPVQLVVDCTGFRGLIINKALGEPFDDYSDWSLNDSARAVQIPHKPGAKLEPCTRSTALGAGWAWRVPLYHRIGTGYVYSSKFRTEEEARAEFLDHLGMTEDEAQPRALKMRVGRTRRSWVKNCVAVGLSGGFVEPLESTAIYMIEMSIRWLSTYLPDRDYPQPLADRFNKNMRDLYEEVRDFIAIHYHLSNRDDTPYWVAARGAERVPERLRENLEGWRYALPEATDLNSAHLFDHHTYAAVLFGKGFYKGKRINRAAQLDKRVWRAFSDAFRQAKADNLKRMPDHRDLLTKLRGEAGQSQKAAAAAMEEAALL
ncbi:MAG: tryptophan halogenase family protein [Neomegalonema sp.]